MPVVTAKMAYDAVVKEMEGDTASSFLWGDLRETVQSLNKSIQDGGLSAECQVEEMEEEQRRSVTPMAPMEEDSGTVLPMSCHGTDVHLRIHF